MSAWSACGQPSASQTPCFQSVPRGTTGQRVEAEAVRLDRLPHVDVRVPDHEHVRAARQALRDAGLLRAGHEVVDEDAQPSLGVGSELLDDGRPGRRCRPGTRPRRPRPAGRRPTPSRAARRRGALRRRCGSAARPGRGRPRPRASRMPCGWAGTAAAREGATSTTGRPSSRKPGPSGNTLRTRWRSSSSTVPRSRSTRMISPQNPVTASSTTRPRSATASSERPRGGSRQSADRTSGP